jgi:predicted DNA-binding transcriptional regulator AlpA
LRASAGHPQITYFSTAHTDIVHSRDTQDVKMKQQRVADSFASPPRLMELERAAAYVGLGRTKFSEMVKAGHMPKPVDLDGSPRWDRIDLDRTVDDLKEIWREAKPRSVIDEALERLKRGGRDLSLPRG